MNSRTQVLSACVVLCCVLLFAAGCGGKKAKGPTMGPPEATTQAEQAGDISYYAGRMDQALLHYETAVEQGADPASVAYRMGYALLAQRKWSLALKSFQAAITEDPQLALAYEGAGLATFHMDEWDMAMDFFQQTVEFLPRHWVPYAYMSAIYRGRGQQAQAQSMNQTAIQLAGGDFTLANSTMLDAYKTAQNLLRLRQMRAERAKGEADEASLVEQETAAAPEQDAVQPEPQPEPVPESIPEPSPVVEQDPRDEVLYDELNAMWETSSPPIQLDPSEGEGVVIVEEKGTTVPVTEPTPGPVLAEPDAPAPDAEPADAGSDVAPAPTSMVERQAEPEPVVEELRPKSTASHGVMTQRQTTGPYGLLDSSYKTESTARSRQEELKSMGLGSRLITVDLGDKGSWVRVMIGRFDTLDEAKEFKGGLEEAFGLQGLSILPLKQ